MLMKLPRRERSTQLAPSRYMRSSQTVQGTFLPNLFDAARPPPVAVAGTVFLYSSYSQGGKTLGTTHLERVALVFYD